MKSLKAGKISALLTAAVLVLVMTVTMSATAFAASVTKDGARDIALRNAGLTSSQVKRIEIEYESDEGVYEIEFVRKSNKAEYSYDISASDGKILEKSVEYVYKHNSSKKKIGKTAAMKKVARNSSFTYAQIKKGTCTYKYSDGEGIYTIRLKSGGKRYEYEVLAPTGKLIEHEWEVLNR